MLATGRSRGRPQQRSTNEKPSAHGNSLQRPRWSLVPKVLQCAITQSFEVLGAAEGVLDDVAGQHLACRVGVNRAGALIQPLQGCRKRLSGTVQFVWGESMPGLARCFERRVHARLSPPDAG